MTDTLSPAMAFASDPSYPPQATISLSQTSLMTPEPTSPGSFYSIKDENLEFEDSKKPTKKRKSWGQELPTPKTNLPPRYQHPHHRITSWHQLTLPTGNEQRQRTRKSNVALSECFVTVKPLNHRGSASDKKWRSLRARRCRSNSKMNLSKSD